MNLLGKLEGVDEDVLGMLNFKIKEVRDECERRVAELLKQINEQQAVISRFESKQKELPVLIDLPIDEIVAYMPSIERKFDLVLDHCAEAYGDLKVRDSFLRKYPQFT